MIFTIVITETENVYYEISKLLENLGLVEIENYIPNLIENIILDLREIYCAAYDG